jgi:hypothetical protein
MTVIIPCVVDNIYTEMAVQYVGFAPWAIWGALWVAYTVTWDGAWQMVSMGVTLSTLPLYVMRFYIADETPGFFCPDIGRVSFPNMEMAAIGAAVVYVLFFRRYYKMVVTYFQWLLLGLFFLVPAIVHVYWADVDFWKVALSIAYGMVVSALTCPLLWTNQKSFAYLFTLPYFWSWYGPSILLRDAESKALYERLRAWRQKQYEEQQPWYTWLQGAFSVLSSRSG